MWIPIKYQPIVLFILVKSWTDKVLKKFFYTIDFGLWKSGTLCTIHYTLNPLCKQPAILLQKKKE